MDSETAWANFKKNNQTSVEDKLDVLLAQQQEILTDTSRVADLVPMVTGNKAELDALEETGDVEGAGPDMTEPPMEDSPMEATEDTEDNPFAFLDEESDSDDEGSTDDGEYQSDDIYIADDDYEETDEESDMEEIESEETPEQSEGSEESDEAIEEDIIEDEDEAEDEESAEDVSESEEASEESDDKEDTEEDEDYISFDEIDEDDEEVNKSSPVTKTIKSLSDRAPMTVVSKVSRPNDSFTFGRANDSEAIGEMLFKGQSNFDIGYGVDPHKVVEKDWADYRMMKKLNTF